MSTESAAVVSEAGNGLPEVWVKYIEPFAQAIGKDVAAITSALKPLVGDPGDEAISLLKNEGDTSFDEIKAALGEGVPVAKFKKAVRGLRSVVVSPVDPATVQAAPAAAMTPSFDVLPSVPSDDAWLDMLKISGKLKPDKSIVISGVRSGLANCVGIYGLTKKLVTRMEAHAESLDEPIGPDYISLQRMLTKRNYAEIFSAIGVDGRYVTVSRRRKFMAKLDEVLWKALSSFNSDLKGWQKSWEQGFNNPSALIGMVGLMAAGNRGAALPPGVLAAPDTAGLRDSAESVINKINKVFSVDGAIVASAMAYDAQQIKTALENPAMPALVGAANRDQMLKMLGVDESGDYGRLERNITRFVLGIMEFPKVQAEVEQTYLSALVMLGGLIPWDRLKSLGGRPGMERSVGLDVVSEDEDE